MRVSCSAIRFLWYWLKIVHVPNNIGWSEVMFRPFRCILPEARPLRQTLLGMLTHWLVGAWRGNINWWTQRRWEQISQSTPQAWLKCSVSEDLHPLLYCRHWTAHITLFCPYQFIVYFVDIAFNHQKKKKKQQELFHHPEHQGVTLYWKVVLRLKKHTTSISICDFRQCNWGMRIRDTEGAEKIV